MAVKAGECDMGLAVGVEKLAGAGLLGGGGTPKSDKNVFEPKGRYGAVTKIDGRIGTETMPGVFAQVGHGVPPRAPVRRRGLRAVRPDQREEPRPLAR